MCGIVGYFGKFEPANLEKASEILAHRGPDSNGFWFNDSMNIGFAHRRLSILDLSPSGAQPMCCDHDAAVLVFNGEIYNFRKLRSRLQLDGHIFRGGSDTEVLLHMYLAYGEKMLTMLNGVFTFALWDKRSHVLFLARDALGVKPLYYTQAAQGFAFASELKSLLQLAEDARTLDSNSLNRYLTFLWCPGEGTPLKNVKKLLPGEALVVKEGEIARKWTWYHLPLFRGVKADLTYKQVLTGLADKLREAVHRQLVADVPVGAFLSGGLDSSGIVALAREKVPNIHCFTIESSGGQESGFSDDLPYAKRVAKYLDVPLDIVQVNASRMADDFEQMIIQLDEPLADPAPLNVLYISKLAHDQGMKVLLSGAGGDDLFTGYRRHVAVNYQHLWQWLPSSVRRGLEGITSHLNQINPMSRRAAKLFNGTGLSGDERLAAYFYWMREVDLVALYSPEFRASLRTEKANLPMLEFLQSLPASVKSLDKVLALEQRFFLADHNLTYTDKMSMATGVEVRVPFLDLEMVEYAQRIPLSYKQHGRVGKWILKKAMEPYLPKDVIYRQKSGFGAPLRRWMRHELRALVGDLLSEESLKNRGIFDYRAVQQLIHKNDIGKVDAAYNILSLLSIEIWCRAYIDS